MKKATRCLLQNIIDYAGLFPPAKLPLTEAFSSFQSYQRHAQNFLLARFILPLASLEQLEALGGDILASSTTPFRLSLLAKNEQAGDSFLRALEHDLHALEGFLSRNASVAVDGIEFLLPEEIQTSDVPAKLVSFCCEVSSRVEKLPQPTRVFVELPLTLGRDRFGSLAHILSLFNRERNKNWAAKIRTGSTVASQVPSPLSVASAIAMFAKNRVAFKCTAGLHEMLRHFDPALGVKVHGVFNVWTAALFAQGGVEDVASLVSILEDEDAKSFVFDDEAFAYKGERFDLAHIEACRKHFALSLGSCSFLEPVASLEHLALL